MKRERRLDLWTLAAALAIASIPASAWSADWPCAKKVGSPAPWETPECYGWTQQGLWSSSLVGATHTNINNTTGAQHDQGAEHQRGLGWGNNLSVRTLLLELPGAVDLVFPDGTQARYSAVSVGTGYDTGPSYEALEPRFKGAIAFLPGSTAAADRYELRYRHQVQVFERLDVYEKSTHWYDDPSSMFALREVRSPWSTLLVERNEYGEEVSVVALPPSEDPRKGARVDLNWTCPLPDCDTPGAERSRRLQTVQDNGSGVAGDEFFISLNYNPADELESVVVAPAQGTNSHEIRFVYDLFGRHQLEEIQDGDDPLQPRLMTYRYDDEGRLISTEDASGYHTAIVPDISNQTEAQVMIVTSGDGASASGASLAHWQTFDMLAGGELYRSSRGDHYLKCVDRDAYGFCTVQEDQTGRRQVFTYAPDGRVQSVYSPDTRAGARFIYGLWDRIEQAVTLYQTDSSLSTGQSFSTLYTYSDANWPTSPTSKTDTMLGTTTRMAYSPQTGGLQTLFSPLGIPVYKATHAIPDGEVTSEYVIDGVPTTTTYQYDPFGRPTQVQRSSPAQTDSYGIAYTTLSGPAGLLFRTTVTDFGRGKTWSHAADTWGQPQLITSPTGQLEIEWSEAGVLDTLRQSHNGSAAEFWNDRQSTARGARGNLKPLVGTPALTDWGHLTEHADPTAGGN